MPCRMFTRNEFNLLLLALSLLCGACSPKNPIPLARAGESGVPVFVIDHGKHAGLAVRKADIPRGFWPETVDFSHADFIEVGWGDWDYYQMEDPGVWVTLKAGGWPTPSVLHVVGIDGDLSRHFPYAEIIRLDLCPKAFLKLIQYIDSSFERMENPRSKPLRRGYYPVSWFYPAKGSFHLFRTCNGWVAEALESTGLPMGWPLPITADQLMSRIRNLLPRRASPEKYDYHHGCVEPMGSL